MLRLSRGLRLDSFGFARGEILQKPITQAIAAASTPKRLITLAYSKQARTGYEIHSQYHENSDSDVMKGWKLSFESPNLKLA